MDVDDGFGLVETRLEALVLLAHLLERVAQIRIRVRLVGVILKVGPI